MRMIGEGMHKAGFTVQGINLPGHAVDVAAMKKTGWNDWLGAARDALANLKRRYRFASVAGLSMGGAISLILAEEGLPTAAVAISAPMAVQNKLMPLAGVLAPMYPLMPWGEGSPAEALKDSRYDLGYSGFPTKCAADLSKLIKMARRNLSLAACPVMAVQSHADDTIDHGSAGVILNGVSSSQKQALWLDEVPHVCTITREAPVIVDAMAAFLRKAERQAER
jgi:carboxylesterase